MNSLGNSVKELNKTVCSTDGLLKGFCEPSMTSKGKNYLLIIGLALFVQYVVPLLVILVLIPVVAGNVIGITLSVILSSFNPLFLLGIIPVIGFDIIFVSVSIVVASVATIAYWIYYVKQLGILAFVPILMWIFGFLIGFVPYIGNIISSLISITPWMALMGILHWFIYKKDSTLKLS